MKLERPAAGTVAAQIRDAVDEIAASDVGKYNWIDRGESRSAPKGAALLAQPPEQLIDLAVAGLRESARLLRISDPAKYDRSSIAGLWRQVAEDLAIQALRRKLPWTEAQLAELLDALLDVARRHEESWLHAEHDPVKPVVRAVEQFSDGPAPESLRGRLQQVAELLDLEYAENKKVASRIGALLGDADGRAPLRAADDPWTQALLAAYEDLPAVAQPVLELAATATGARPTKTFTAARDELLSGRGRDGAAQVTVALLRAGAIPGAGAQVPSDVGDVLRGLCWIAAAAGGDDAAVALGDLAIVGWKKVPGHGPLCAKAANAAIGALGEIGDGAAQLGRIRPMLKQPAAQKVVDAAIDQAAETLGIPRAEFEELVVPDFGLDVDGRRSLSLGEHAAELALTDTLTAELRFHKADGAALKSVPAAVKRDHADELAALKRTAKDLKAMAAAQRLRLERLLLDDRAWTQAAWRERYVHHGLVGVLARRLIWTLDLPGGPRSVICDPGSRRLLDSAGETVEPGDAAVRLWHPVDADPGEVLAWRTYLEERQVTQPFKQAHREVYLLTDAERATGTYSNRFAAHVLRQHQMGALARARGWTYALQGAWDTLDEQAELHLPGHGLRVTFWVDRPWDSEDWNEAGVYNHVLSDQVRFRRERAPENDPLPLDTIAPRVFSEAMRDVDLFVGVTSIGNDPAWLDHGLGDNRYRAYWTDYSFGQLGQAAEVRRDLLERLLPKLVIADRARLDGRFLRVDGRLRGYKIHLGSGNILMEPNDEYLCIVPGRGDDTPANVFLPFEGDRTLAVILSKALMLAADDQITDTSITTQIGRG